MLTHFSLFTGIGGIDLAAEWAGFETVGQCEWAEFPRKVLEKHWPNVPRWRDVRDVTAESIRAAGIERIDLLSGGYPCQPFSLAGKRKGQDDDRHLWPEMFRIIQETRPSWVIGENVAGHITMGLDEVLSDMESEGYTTQTFVIPACSVGAFHRRDRVFIVANDDSKLWETTEIHSATNTKSTPKTPKEWNEFQFHNRGANNIVFREEDQSKLCRDDDGVPIELDEGRLKALGNAVNPYQVYPILKTIYEIETGMISWNT